MPEILIINFAKGASRTGSRSTTGSRKLANVGGLGVRNITEKNGRELRGILVKNGW